MKKKYYQFQLKDKILKKNFCTENIKGFKSNPEIERIRTEMKI
jgi:hypothetical protein